MKLEPLKNPLEGRITLLRVYPSLFNELTLTKDQRTKLVSEVRTTYYSISSEPLTKVNQKRIFGKCKSKKKVSVYPIEYIPVMINIIKQFKDD